MILQQQLAEIGQPNKDLEREHEALQRELLEVQGKMRRADKQLAQAADVQTESQAVLLKQAQQLKRMHTELQKAREVAVKLDGHRQTEAALLGDQLQSAKRELLAVKETAIKSKALENGDQQKEIYERETCNLRAQLAVAEQKVEQTGADAGTHCLRADNLEGLLRHNERDVRELRTQLVDEQTVQSTLKEEVQRLSSQVERLRGEIMSLNRYQEAATRNTSSKYESSASSVANDSAIVGLKCATERIANFGDETVAKQTSDHRHATETAPSASDTKLHTSAELRGLLKRSSGGQGNTSSLAVSWGIPNVREIIITDEETAEKRDCYQHVQASVAVSELERNEITDEITKLKAQLASSAKNADSRSAPPHATSVDHSLEASRQLLLSEAGCSDSTPRILLSELENGSSRDSRCVLQFKSVFAPRCKFMEH